MTSLTLALFGLVVAIALLSLAITAGVRAWAVSAQALVSPTERCAHTIPTPHGGGVAIASASMMLALMFSLMCWVPVTSMLAFVGLGFAIMVLGVWDDFCNISAKCRLFVHFVIVIVGLLSIPALPAFSFSGYEFDASSIRFFWPLQVVAWVWLINLYNFMDGIDGLAAVQALVLFGGMALNFWYMGFAEWSWMCLFLLAAVLGFTILNWPPAKIFMGDGGSGFLGFIIGFLMLLSISQTMVSLWSWLILLVLFISDATVTLITRLITGQGVLQAHNLHAYQKLSRRCGRHLPVTAGYGLVMLLVLVPVSWLANVFSQSGPFLFALVFALCSSFMMVTGAGQIEAPDAD